MTYPQLATTEDDFDSPMDVTIIEEQYESSIITAGINPALLTGDNNTMDTTVKMQPDRSSSASKRGSEDSSILKDTPASPSKSQSKRRRLSRRRQADENSERSNSSDSSFSDDEGEDESLYCICNRPDDGKFMISCDKCTNWFHGKCVGMTKDKAKKQPDWKCPNCMQTTAMETTEELTVAMTEQSPKIESRKSSSSSPIVTKAPSKRNSKQKNSKNTSGVLDQVRQRVVQNIEKVLESGRVALLNLSNKTERDQFKIPNINEIDLHELAEQIELALNNALTGDAYKEKFRTLHFNLKDHKNAYNVISGNISPEKLVTMSAEDLANEHLKHMKEKVQEESLRESVLTEEMASVILKKTHKGEVAVEKPQLSVNTSDPLAQIISKSGVEPPPYTPLELTSAVPLSTPKVQSINASEESLAKISQDGPSNTTSTTTLVDVPITESYDFKGPSSPPDALKPQETNALDALLAKVNVDSSIKPVDVQETSTSPQYEDYEEEKSPMDLIETDYLDEVPVMWNGNVGMHAVGQFKATAKFAGGVNVSRANEWKEILTPTFDIGGRINHESVFTYLDEQVYNETRNITLLAVEMIKDGDKKGFSAIWDYFVSRKRFAVVKNTFARVKDMYLLPIGKEDDLPDFMSALDHIVPVYGRCSNILLAVIVHVPKSHLKETTKPSSKKPSPTEKTGGNLDHALSLLGSIVPSISAPVPQFSPSTSNQSPSTTYPAAPQQSLYGMPPHGGFMQPPAPPAVDQQIMMGHPQHALSGYPPHQGFDQFGYPQPQQHLHQHNQYANQPYGYEDQRYHSHHHQQQHHQHDYRRHSGGSYRGSGGNDRRYSDYGDEKGDRRRDSKGDRRYSRGGGGNRSTPYSNNR